LIMKKQIRAIAVFVLMTIFGITVLVGCMDMEQLRLDNEFLVHLVGKLRAYCYDNDLEFVLLLDNGSDDDIIFSPDDINSNSIYYNTNARVNPPVKYENGVMVCNDSNGIEQLIVYETDYETQKLDNNTFDITSEFVKIQTIPTSSIFGASIASLQKLILENEVDLDNFVNENISEFVLSKFVKIAVNINDIQKNFWALCTVGINKFYYTVGQEWIIDTLD